MRRKERRENDLLPSSPVSMADCFRMNSSACSCSSSKVASGSDDLTAIPNLFFPCCCCCCRLASLTPNLGGRSLRRAGGAPEHEAVTAAAAVVFVVPADVLSIVVVTLSLSLCVPSYKSARLFSSFSLFSFFFFDGVLLLVSRFDSVFFSRPQISKR